MGPFDVGCKKDIRTLVMESPFSATQLKHLFYLRNAAGSLPCPILLTALLTARLREVTM